MKGSSVSNFHENLCILLFKMEMNGLECQTFIRICIFKMEKKGSECQKVVKDLVFRDIATKTGGNDAEFDKTV